VCPDDPNFEAKVISLSKVGKQVILGWLGVPGVTRVCSAAWVWECFDAGELEGAGSGCAGCVVALLGGPGFRPGSAGDS
jgi:hypothetical protein